MTKHPVLIAAAAILLLGLGAVAAILYATGGEAFGLGEAFAWRRSSPGHDAQTQVGAPAAPPVSAPQVLVPAPDPLPPSPTAPLPAPDWYKAGDPPVIVAAPAPKLPHKKEERQQVEIGARKQKFATSMDALNRRAAARLGLPPPIPPSVPPAPAAYNSRRGAVSAAEPVRRPEQDPQ